MVFLKYFYLLIISFLVLINSWLSGQILFKNLPQKESLINDSLFFDIGKTRKIKLLHGNWKVYSEKSDKAEQVDVEIPSIFEGETDFIFEKSFTLNTTDIANSKLTLHFLGLNYSADISLNNISIYRHTGGEYPFSFDLPKDILRSHKANVLKVRLSNVSNSETTIPVKQKFLFPKIGGGIFRDVYIHFTPNVFISNINSNIKFDEKSKKYYLISKIKIENKEVSVIKDTSGNSEFFTLNTTLRSSYSEIQIKTNETKFHLGKNKEIYLTHSFELNPGMFWSPANPKSYLLSAAIIRAENLVDRTVQPIALYDLDVKNDVMMLNNQDIKLSGVTYYPIYEDLGGLISYTQMERDIKLIKETGFNVIRFAKRIPHPYYLTLCQQYGLLPFIELPINSVPSNILSQNEFNDRVSNYLNFFLKGFRNRFVAAIGLGSSFNGNSEIDIKFIGNLAQLLKKKTDAITYASFLDGPLKKIKNLDFYGLELLNKPANNSYLNELLVSQQFSPNKIFISEASYIVSRGSSDGYLNTNSFEAQAKFLEDIIDYSNNNSLLGYFLNSMYDYRSEYASIISGYNEENLLQIGLADENRDTDRMSYKVIFAKLNNIEKVTIPIGSKKDDSPMLFIIFGILIAIIMGIMINSGKKFREDASRALLRPYNFFADVRDQRLISIIHSLIILIIIASTSGLLLSNILYYLKENIRFERLLLSFGSSSLMQNVSYLAWNPLASIWWLSIITVIVFFILILIVKAASFFVRTRVTISSVFHAVIWSFLPLVILVPLGIILYRILSVEAVNIYLFIGMFVFTVWIFYRLMKGIYVIFDINSASVYLYSIIILFIITASLIIYLQLSNSTITYILHALKDYKFLG